MPVPLTWNQIKALTEVGDSPNNADRADVWDSIAYYIQQANDKADAAVATVAALQGKVARCFGLVELQFTNLTGPVYGTTTTKAAGCGIASALTFVANGSGWALFNAVVTITPDDDFPDDDFT